MISTFIVLLVEVVSVRSLVVVKMILEKCNMLHVNVHVLVLCVQVCDEVT